MRGVKTLLLEEPNLDQQLVRCAIHLDRFLWHPADILGYRHTRMLARRSVLLSIAGIPVIARADLYDDYINSKSKQPFVAFLGRKGSTSTVGHSFVGTGVQIDSGLRVYERLFGLYPKDDSAIVGVKSAFSKTSGKLDYKWSDISWDTEIIRTVDEMTKKAVLAHFSAWSKDAPEFSVIANGGINCNVLTSLVAKTCSMKVPDGAGTTRPWKYIEALKDLNK